MGVTIGPHSKDRVVDKVESEVNTEDSYELDLLIPKNNHTENFPFCNLADVLANSFGNLSTTSIDFHFSLTFLVISSHFAVSDGISGYKPLDFISFGGPATWNLGNILVFYY